MLEHVANWLENHMQPCMYRQYLGIECPGCGFQRALIALLRGHFAESIQLFPGLMPMILLFLFLILHLIFKFKWGALVLKFVFIADMAIIMIHYMIHLIH